MNYGLQLLGPDAGVQHRFPEEFQGDHYAFMKQFMSLEEGTVLWQVYAKGSPSMHVEYLGHIELVSKFTTSNYADQTLFFRHQPVEDDIAVGGQRVQGWLVRLPLKCIICECALLV